jgi:hypothetical protein
VIVQPSTSASGAGRFRTDPAITQLSCMFASLPAMQPDLIVVGARSSGCVIARRFTERTDRSQCYVPLPFPDLTGHKLYFATAASSRKISGP